MAMKPKRQNEYIFDRNQIIIFLSNKNVSKNKNPLRLHFLNHHDMSARGPQGFKILEGVI